MGKVQLSTGCAGAGAGTGVKPRMIREKSCVSVITHSPGIGCWPMGRGYEPMGQPVDQQTLG